MPKTKSSFKHSYLQIIAAVSILLLALLLLWHGSATSNQAIPALLAQVYFDGEYRIADGDWQEIAEGEHIPSTKGDVTLRGNFHTLTPDGEYIGIYSGDLPIALYTDHIGLTIYEGENEPYVMDVENPLFGASLAAGVGLIVCNHLEEKSAQNVSKDILQDIRENIPVNAHEKNESNKSSPDESAEIPVEIPVDLPKEMITAKWMAMTVSVFLQFLYWNLSYRS